MAADLFAVVDGAAVNAAPFSRNNKKATDEQVLSAYARFGSVKGAGRALGMCGQSVHERLVRLGKNRSPNLFSVADDRRLIREYEKHANNGTLARLAGSFNRTKYFLCRQAARLGLTNTRRKKPYAAERLMGVAIWHGRQHPRGMLGKKHKMAVRIRLSSINAARWAAMSKDQKIRLVENQKVSWKSGWREIGGVRCFYRSRWEANYARYLEWLKQRGEITSWEHEPETFWFEKIRRGTRSYLPDFKVEQRGRVTYHEVKGWMDRRSKTKLRRMAKYYPSVVLVLVEKKQYKAIGAVVGPLISGWE